jgi:hypothetical protein
MKLVSLCVSALVAPLLLAQVSVPQVGVARFRDGALHAVRGLPSNFVVTSAPLASASQASFSDAGGLIARDGVIWLLAADATPIASYTAAESSPILNMDGPASSAIAWLPSSHSLLQWNGHVFALTEIDAAALAGEVTSLRLLNPTTARLLVTHSDSTVSAVLVSLKTGNVVDSQIVPGLTGPAFLQGGFLLGFSPNGLCVEALDGSHRLLSLTQNRLPAGDLSIERMSSDWLHVSSSSTDLHWALHLSSTELHLSLLPPPPAGLATAHLAAESAQ